MDVTGMRLPAGEYVIIVSHDESDSILEDYNWSLANFVSSPN
jgi:hypothetical protein